MITTKRYDYVQIDRISEHPDVRNHRPVDPGKVDHYFADIQKHGLLEPLVVWERNHGEFFLVGGFHRIAAMRGIRQANPGHFDQVDVRVVGGDVDDMRALNLKLNSDRLDTKITDYFDTIVHLTNVNWPLEKIAEFLDKSASWVEEIVRFAPIMPREIRELLERGELTWSKSKMICRAIKTAEPGQEKAELERQLTALNKVAKTDRPKRPVTMRQAKERFSNLAANEPMATYTLSSEDLLSLVLVLDGKDFSDSHKERVARKLPALFSKS
jgi:ParB family transcriptional regulator, chromosome partitioning protein